MSDPLDLVRAGIPDMHNCPVLTRLSAFLVDQGVAATLEHVMRNRIGKPLDLSTFFLQSSSESVSDSGDMADSRVRLRVKEWLGFSMDECTNPIWTLPGWCSDPEDGLVRSTLLPEIVEHSGIYELSWGLFDTTGRLVFTNEALLSVERTLWPADPMTRYRNLGPITVGELRMEVMDSSPNENTLLDDVEFSDAQLLRALIEPIRMWNETPPPIEVFTTRNFPFRGAWLHGSVGQLHLMAASHYRRNYLASEGGGLKIEDKNKEREYMAEGQRRMDLYTGWLRDKKVSINMYSFVGANSSRYLDLGGW